MFIRTLDQRLLQKKRFVLKSAPIPQHARQRHRIYPLRILARVFTVIGLAAAVYAAALVGLFFHSGIIVF